MKTDIEIFADFLAEVITTHWNELEVTVFKKLDYKVFEQMYSMYQNYKREKMPYEYEYSLDGIYNFVSDKKADLLSLMNCIH